MADLYIALGYIALMWQLGWLGLALAAAHVAILFFLAGGRLSK